MDLPPGKHFIPQIANGSRLTELQRLLCGEVCPSIHQECFETSAGALTQRLQPHRQRCLRHVEHVSL